VANLHPVIDLRRRKVLRVDDFGAVPLAPDSGDIVQRTNLRADIKPLEIVQPEGPSFTVEGRRVRWQNWDLRLGFNGREGLVLYEIGYHDKGRLRPIMHRASLAEMVVPYGDPTGGNVRRNAFDTGEYGVGQLVDSLTLGCDCLGHIHYFDATLHDWHGAPRVVRNALCLHEEDFGILWKFSDTYVDPIRTTVTRSRRLVISFFSTIGNYVYGFFWYFYQDGTIGIEVKATGVPFPTGTRLGDSGPYGEIMADGIVGHVHQHVFSFRFDMSVDGDRNAVREVNFSGAAQGPGNPHGNAIRTAVTRLETERAAQREMDFGSARYWLVTNPNARNRFGNPVAYKLVPGVNARTFLAPDAPVLKRARFMEKHFWATRYARDELYPAGWYPNQHAGGDGLPRWTAADRSLENEDVVVWYTLNYHHLSRPEDWPVQPVVYANVHWMPFGFFDSNPALDVPASVPRAAHCC
jgi:primary-amine oxidase